MNDDTSPEIAELVRTRLMALPGADRFEMGCRSFDAARKMMIASFPNGLSRREFKRLLYQRTYGQPAPEGAFVD
jgi:hypothetical protein